MKIIYTLFIFGLSLTASGQSEFSKQTVAADPPFKLEITANLEKGHSENWDFANSAQTVVKASSMIVVAIRKTNISNYEIDKSTHAEGFYGYYYDVRDSRGNLVGPRKPNEVKLKGDGRGGHLIGTKDNVLQPGESMIGRERVDDGYDLGKPGTYTIQISQHVSNDPASEVVKSNIITVTVLPADDPPTAQQ
jgi:hypothetical protein